MIARRYLYSCAIGLCMAAVVPSVLTGTVPMARAEAPSSAMLQPVTGWAVSKVGNPDTPSGYCALARRFSNNIVVTIAQNKKQEASFAIDFQKDTIRVGRSYAVQISTGSLKRDFDIQSVSASALVIKIGADNAFFAMLEKEQILSVSISGQPYQFSFSDFASGRQQLSACLGNNAAQTMVSKEMSDQMSRMKTELVQLQDENRSLLSDLEKERQNFRQEMSSKGAQNSDVQELMDKMGNLERSNTELMQKLQQEQTANTGLKTNLDRLTSTIKKDDNADMATKLAVEAAQRERDELRAMLEMEKSRRSEIEKLAVQKDGIEKQQSELMSRIAELEQQNASLGMMLDEEQKSRTDIEGKLKNAGISKDEYDRLMSENKSLQQTVDSMKNAGVSNADVRSREAEAARMALKETQDEMDRLRSERDTLVEMMEKERKDFSTHVNRQDTASAEVKEMAEKLAKLESQNAELMRSLQNSKDNKAANAAQSDEAAEQLALQSRAVDASKDEIQELKAMLAMERDERMRLARLMIEQGESKGNAQGEGKAAVDAGGEDFRKRIEQVEAENERLRIALKVAATESAPVVDGQAIQEARARIEEKARQLELVSAERDELKGLLEAERTRREKIAGMLEQKKDVTEEKTELNGKLRALEARNMELARALEEAKKRKPEPVQIGEVVARPPMMADGSPVSGSVSGLAAGSVSAPVALSGRDNGRTKDGILNSLSGSNTEIAQVKAELEIALAERDEYRSLLESERLRLREVQSLRNRIGNISGDQASLTDTIQKLQNEKVDLIRSLEYERARLEEIGGKKGGASVTGETGHAEVSALKAERNELRRLLEEERHRKQEIASLEKRVSSVTQDETDLSGKVAKLETEKEELSNLLKNAQREAEAARVQSTRFVQSSKDLSPAAADVVAGKGGADNDRLRLLENENRRLYSEMNALQAKKSEVEAMEAEISSLKAQNNILRGEVKARKADLSNGIADDDMLAHLRETISRLDMQNKNLNEALEMARQREEKALKNNPYREKLIEAETRIQDVLGENAILSRELEEIRTDAEKRLLKVADGDHWDATKATTRYQEAEREIQRLGEVLNRERAKHQDEVRELEGKLFDPAITEAEQLKRLRDMEAEIARLQGGHSLSRASDDTPRMQAMPVGRVSSAAIDPQSSADADRELRRLNELLQRERASHQAEVRDLEGKLFDPAITEAEQLRRLNEMEAEIARLRSAKGEAGTVVAARPTASRQPDVDFGPSNDPMPEVAQAKTRDTTNDASANDTANNTAGMSSIQKLRNRIARGRSQESLSEREGRVVSDPDSRSVAVAAVSSDVEAAPVEPVMAEVTTPTSSYGTPQPAMTPIMDGPGERELAMAVHQGGAVVYSPSSAVQQPTSQTGVPLGMAPMAMAPVSGQVQNSVQPPVAQPAPQPYAQYNQYAQPAAAQVSYQPQPMMPPSSQPPQIQFPQHAAPVSAPAGPDGQDIASLLVKAGVPLVSGFEKVGAVSNSGFSAFRWDTGTVYGSAEKTLMSDPSMFEAMVEGYLRKTEARCGGTFDKTSSGMTYAGARPVLAYDIACISGDQGAGAALLFYADGGTFNVIAHEGGIESFDQAMTTRDQLSNSLIR